MKKTLLIIFILLAIGYYQHSSKTELPVKSEKTEKNKPEQEQKRSRPTPKSNEHTQGTSGLLEQNPSHQNYEPSQPHYNPEPDEYGHRDYEPSHGDYSGQNQDSNQMENHAYSNGNPPYEADQGMNQQPYDYEPEQPVPAPAEFSGESAENLPQPHEENPYINNPNHNLNAVPTTEHIQPGEFGDPNSPQPPQDYQPHYEEPAQEQPVQDNYEQENF